MKTPRFCVDCGAPLTCANKRVTRCAFCLHRRRAEVHARKTAWTSEKKGGAK